jgi:hypothetical protein
MNISVGDVLDFIEETERTHLVTSWYSYKGKVRSLDHSIRSMLGLGFEDVLPRKSLLTRKVSEEFRLLKEFVQLKAVAERTVPA